MDEPNKLELDKVLPFAMQKRLNDPQEGMGVLLRRGMVCPQCGLAKLDYDGMLNLSCPHCGFSAGGGCHT